MITGELAITSFDFHRVISVHASEPFQQAQTGAWIAHIEIRQQIPSYLADKKAYHKETPVTVTKLTLFLNKNENEDPAWKAGMIYEVPNE